MFLRRKLKVVTKYFLVNQYLAIAIYIYFNKSIKLKQRGHLIAVFNKKIIKIFFFKRI